MIEYIMMDYFIPAVLIMDLLILVGCGIAFVYYGFQILKTFFLYK